MISDFRKEKFFTSGLDDPNPLEAVAEFRFFAPFILLASEPRARRSHAKIAQLICPTSDSQVCGCA